MEDDIKWEDPPGSARVIGRSRRGRYQAFAEGLRKNPRRWAQFPTEATTEASATGQAQNLYRGKVKGFEDGLWEVAVEGLAVWVRYLGPKEDEDEEDKDEEPVSNSLAPQVRAWAKEQGMEVSERGALPRHVTDAYFAAVDRGDPSVSRLRGL